MISNKYFVFVFVLTMAMITTATVAAANTSLNYSNAVNVSLNFMFYKQ